MAGARRLGGIIFFNVNGEGFQAKGEFTYNLGAPKRDGIIGSDVVHGFKETVQIPRIEGAITDSPELDVKDFINIVDGTATLSLNNGKRIVLRNCWFAGEADITSEEGEIAILFQGLSAEEVGG